MVTTAYIKDTWLGLTGDATQDALITALINTATKEIEAMCGQPLLAVTGHVIAVPKLDHSTYLLPFALIPVVTTKLEYRTKPTDTWTTATSTTYAVHKDRAGWWLYSQDYFVYPYYQLTADVGYAVGVMPEELKAACGLLVKELYHQSGASGTTDRFGLAAISDGNPSGSTSLTLQSVRPSIQAGIAHYVVRNRP